MLMSCSLFVVDMYAVLVTCLVVAGVEKVNVPNFA